MNEELERKNKLETIFCQKLINVLNKTTDQKEFDTIYNVLLTFYSIVDNNPNSITILKNIKAVKEKYKVQKS